MPRQRNVFRIEELCAPAPTALPAGNGADQRHAELLRELRALRAVLSEQEKPQTAANGAATAELQNELGSIYEAVQRTKQEVATLMLGFADPEMGRVSRELNAVVDGSASATHRILQACEEIEEAAKTLSASLKSVQNQDLARDILDQVTHIFEACNFQDIAGQRVNKVNNTLKFIEEHILRMMQVWGGAEHFADVEPAARAEIKKYPHLVNGPMLEGDKGGTTQDEIDAMFN